MLAAADDDMKGALHTVGRKPAHASCLVCQPFEQKCWCWEDNPPQTICFPYTLRG